MVAACHLHVASPAESAVHDQMWLSTELHNEVTIDLAEFSFPVRLESD